MVTTLVELVRELTSGGHRVEVIHPRLFRTRPCPGYAGIDLAVSPRRALAEQLDGMQPDAIHIANDTIYGLSSSLYTRDINKAFVGIRDIKAGITYINVPTIGAEAHMPFGGVKQTGNGHREGGWTVYDFYTEWKAVYIDYSGKLQRAQIDNY